MNPKSSTKTQQQETQQQKVQSQEAPKQNAKKQELQKSPALFLLSALLLLGSLIFTVYAYRNSYLASLTAEGDVKSSLQRPYAYGLTFVFFSAAVLLKGIYNMVIGVPVKQKKDVKRLALAGLMSALCYIGFTFFKIDIPVGTEKTAFHFGNVFCVLAALLLGGYWGGLAGAIGMTIGDLTTAYVTSAPKTFVLKLCIGAITGLTAHKLFKLSREHNPKYITVATITSCICGMAFNTVADPLVGYFYKMYLLGVPQQISSALSKIGAVTTFVNSVVAVITASAFYLALRPALKKSNLFPEITPKPETPKP